jgi:hypothetical protein
MSSLLLLMPEAFGKQGGLVNLYGYLNVPKEKPID